MRIVIAGGHGKIALQLGTLLAARGDTAVGLIRDPAQQDDLRAAGMEPVVLDLEGADAEAVAKVLAGADAAVFAAGAGPSSGPARKDTVDRAGSVLLAQACELAGVDRFLQVSSMGVESVRGTSPQPDDDVFAVYLRAKLAAEEDLRSRPLAWIVLRPGGLTDGPATGRVRLAPSVESGRVPRADVAAVLLALLDAPSARGLVLELVGGDVPVADAVAAVVRPG
ncbi:MAG TPA: NAD(P)H-binding protein [Kineosporiaceae bacterium]|nr:NAD(P)H-binding protein [Kineosporiaceae bacterium]